nr:transposase [Paenibacillus wynnii]
MAKTLLENIPFIWLAGRQRPDFRTLNRFRFPASRLLKSDSRSRGAFACS